MQGHRSWDRFNSWFYITTLCCYTSCSCAYIPNQSVSTSLLGKSPGQNGGDLPSFMVVSWYFDRKSSGATKSPSSWSNHQKSKPSGFLVTLHDCSARINYCNLSTTWLVNNGLIYPEACGYPLGDPVGSLLKSRVARFGLRRIIGILGRAASNVPGATGRRGGSDGRILSDFWLISMVGERLINVWLMMVDYIMLVDTLL